MPPTSGAPVNEVWFDDFGRRYKILVEYPRKQHLTQEVWRPDVVRG